jgi:hypothetical protein
MARVRRGAAEWVRLIDEWHASGLNLSVFCRRLGLNFATMQGWVYKSTHKEALEKARRAPAGNPRTIRPRPKDSCRSGSGMPSRGTGKWDTRVSRLSSGRAGGLWSRRGSTRRP